MEDLDPPPLFSPTNAGDDATDSGGIIVAHGEIPRRERSPTRMMFTTL